MSYQVIESGRHSSVIASYLRIISKKNDDGESQYRDPQWFLHPENICREDEFKVERWHPGLTYKQEDNDKVNIPNIIKDQYIIYFT